MKVRLTALVLVVVVIAVVALTTGDDPVPLATLFGGGDAADRLVVGMLRLPRLLAGLFVGAALGAGGAVFQSVSRNPLGSPDIVGFDIGAATSALLVLLVWHGSAVALGAVAGGVGTALLVYLLAMRRGVRGHRLILVGIGIAAMLSSVNAFVLTRADVTDAQSAAVWLTGSLNGREWTDIRPILLALPVLLPLALWLGRDLRMLELGDDTARALGVGAERTRLAAIVVGVGMTAVATACAGTVTFVALAAPQVARRLTRVTGPNVLPAALTGAALLTGADLAARRLLLPVGVLTGVFGGIYLAFLLRRAA